MLRSLSSGSFRESRCYIRKAKSMPVTPTPKPEDAKPANGEWPWWHIAGLALVDILFLAAFTAGLAYSVTWQKWIGAQISLLGILVVLAISAWELRRLILHMRAAQADKNKKNEKDPDWGIITATRLAQFIAFGVVAIVIYAIRTEHWISGTVAQVIGAGLLTAGASLGAGGFVGFLFGVPKSTQPAADNGGSKPSGSASESNSKDDKNDGTKPAYGGNTNLEQISDWLTKTIVGVSLVEFHKLPPYLGKLSEYVAAGLDGDPLTTKAIALVIMVYFASTGFLVGYLWTRIYLTRAFNDSTVSKRLDDLENQVQLDTEARMKVDRWLNHHNESQQSRADLMQSIIAASPRGKGDVFLDAEEFRNKGTCPNWAEIQNRSDVTLPIFQALVEADSDKTFHRNRSQYAFALMTLQKPDYQKALDAIEEAIVIRDRARDRGWKEYEFARAVCKIKLYPNAKNDPTLAADINRDLSYRGPNDDARCDPLDLDQVVADWAGTAKKWPTTAPATPTAGGTTDTKPGNPAK
jgi:hypothetical protein